MCKCEHMELCSAANCRCHFCFSSPSQWPLVFSLPSSRESPSPSPDSPLPLEATSLPASLLSSKLAAPLENGVMAPYRVGGGGIEQPPKPAEELKNELTVEVAAHVVSSVHSGTQLASTINPLPDDPTPFSTGADLLAPMDELLAPISAGADLLVPISTMKDLLASVGTSPPEITPTFNLGAEMVPAPSNVANIALAICSGAEIAPAPSMGAYSTSILFTTSTGVEIAPVISKAINRKAAETVPVVSTEVDRAPPLNVLATKANSGAEGAPAISTGPPAVSVGAVMAPVVSTTDGMIPGISTAAEMAPTITGTGKGPIVTAKIAPVVSAGAGIPRRGVGVASTSITGAGKGPTITTAIISTGATTGLARSGNTTFGTTFGTALTTTTGAGITSSTIPGTGIASAIFAGAGLARTINIGAGITPTISTVAGLRHAINRPGIPPTVSITPILQETAKASVVGPTLEMVRPELISATNTTTKPTPPSVSITPTTSAPKQPAVHPVTAVLASTAAKLASSSNISTAELASVVSMAVELASARNSALQRMDQELGKGPKASEGMR